MRTAYAMSTRIAITDRNFADEVLGAPQAAIVYFYGNNCPVCRRVAAALQVLATELPETVPLASVDIRRCRSLVRRLGIVMFPTLIVFVRGVERLRLRGEFRPDELSSTICRLSAGPMLEAGQRGAR
jgi:thioredoxin 1